MAQGRVTHDENYWKTEPLQYFLSHFRYLTGTDLKFLELKLFGLFYFGLSSLTYTIDGSPRALI